MARRAGERRTVTFRCGHRGSVLVSSIARGRAYCAACGENRLMLPEGPRACAWCGTRLNSYNTGNYCGAHERPGDREGRTA